MWAPGELRVGLGCMRLDDEDGPATIAAALAAGVTVFDTARAYPGSESLLGRTLAGQPGARVVSKGGMARPGGQWVPDGRARAIRADCEASREALDVPLAAAQVNTVLRMLGERGRLLEPEELDGKTPAALAPSAHHRTMRSLEPPAADEGFSSLETVPFARRPMPGAPARFIALDLLLDDDDRLLPGAAALVTGEPAAFAFGWRPGRAALPALAGLIEARHCPHAGGPPRCWCRPPLPGLLLAVAVERGLDPAASTIVGASPAHRQMADALGARYLTS